MTVKEKESPFKSLRYTLVMSIISLVMLAEYTRLVVVTDQTPRRVVVLFLWLVIAVVWVTMFLVRLKERKRSA